MGTCNSTTLYPNSHPLEKNLILYVQPDGPGGSDAPRGILADLSLWNSRIANFDRSIVGFTTAPPHPHMGMWRGCTDGREEAASTDAWCTITTYPIQLGLGCHYEQHSRGRCASSSIDINRWYSVICVLDITTIINERRVEGGSHFVERRRRRRDVRTRSVAVTTISGNYLLPFDRYCRYAERSTIVTHIHIICSHTQGRLPHLIRIQATQT